MINITYKTTIFADGKERRFESTVKLNGVSVSLDECIADAEWVMESWEEEEEWTVMVGILNENQE